MKLFILTCSFVYHRAKHVDFIVINKGPCLHDVQPLQQSESINIYFYEEEVIEDNTL
jgi:hypothetical protein